jgi:hypothetical protein
MTMPETVSREEFAPFMNCSRRSAGWPRNTGNAGSFVGTPGEPYEDPEELRSTISGPQRKA